MERERLTITLRKDILKLVDQSIDGAKLRNRSHAIEYYLSQELSPKSVRVVVAVNGNPRPTYQANNMQMPRGNSLKTILQHISKQDFKDVLLIGPEATALEVAAIDAESLELNVKTCTVPNFNGNTAETALNYASQMLKDETFIFWDARFTDSINLADLLDYHKATQGTGTAALLVGREASSSIELDGQVYGKKITSLGQGLPLVGIFVFEPGVVAGLGEDAQNLYSQILPGLAKEGELNAFVFSQNQEVRQRAFTGASQSL